MSPHEADRRIHEATLAAPLHTANSVVQTRHVGPKRLPSRVHPIGDPETLPMEAAHFQTKRLDLDVAELLREEIIERLLPVEDDPLVLFPVGEDLTVLEEHGGQEVRIPRSPKSMNPLVDAVVVLAKVNVRTVARALGDHVMVVL